MAYVYGKATYNGITLHYMKTTASNIVLRRINSNVTASGHYGINGGFYILGEPIESQPLLSLTVNNDVPVGSLIFEPHTTKVA